MTAIVWGGFKLSQLNTPIGHFVGSYVAANEILSDLGSPRSGPSNASVRFVVFTDYRCPACRYSFSAMEEAVRKDGDVQLIYKDYPIFGPISERAARVALASDDQGLYHKVHYLLMTDNRSFTDMTLKAIITEAGGSWIKIVDYIFTWEQRLTRRLQMNVDQALSIGITGTPGYLAENLFEVGSLEEDGFSRLFKQARKKG